TEQLVPCSEDEGWTYVNERGGAQVVYEKYLTPYRQSAGASSSHDHDSKEGAWEYLTQHVRPELLTRFTKGEEWTISSASSGIQDRDEIPGLSHKEVEDVIGEEKELLMLGIDMKRTWREGAVGRERTEGARDRSWLLGDAVTRHEGEAGGGWGSANLGQTEVCFLMVLTLANYSCLEEWKRILAMILTCEKAVQETPSFFAEFLRLLKRQLERVNDVEGGLFDMSDDGGSFLKALLKGFKRILEQSSEDKSEGVDEVKEEFDDVEQWVREQYGWELGDEFARRGMLELEDGEMVEMETAEMEGEDESGEYAPVVVEL
ncbi:MAG: hypothetical protein Q9201_004571, partial [Fulgogasparrea decipioides]